MAEAAAQSIDVDELVDQQKFGRFATKVLVLALIALIADGYDVQVMSFAAPSLAKVWHVGRPAFGPAFSASLFGILFGAPLFGWIGDKLGRKPCIVISSAAYGLICLACTQAQNLDQLILLRFLTGIGLGGVMPNAIAIATELSPRRTRAALASVIAVGITIGGVVPGLLVANLPPAGAWKTLFLIGGLVPLAIAALMAAALPESLAFLVQRGGSRERIVKLLKGVAPEAEIGPETRFHLRPAPPAAGFGALFAGRLALVTPLLWLMFASTLLTIYMLSSWLPLLFSAAGFTPGEAAWANSMFQAGGVIGCVVASLLLGRFGMKLVALVFILTLAAIGAVARAPLPYPALVAGIAVCGACVIGLQGALNGTAGLAYPTAARARGVGMALGVGRVGSVIGPLIGGMTVAAGVHAPRDLFLLPLLPLGLGTIAAIVVAIQAPPRRGLDPGGIGARTGALH